MNSPPSPSDREAVARALLERGRGVHDAPSWEGAGEEMQEWLLGHADAALEAVGFASLLSERDKLRKALERIRDARLGVRDPAGDGGTYILTGHEYRQLQDIARQALSPEGDGR